MNMFRAREWRKAVISIRQVIVEFIREFRQRIKDVYETLQVPELGNSRLFEIFRPLLAIAKILDEILAGWNFYGSLLRLAIAQREREKAKQILLDPNIILAGLVLEYVKTPADKNGSYIIDKLAYFIRQHPEFSNFRAEEVRRRLNKIGVILKAHRYRFPELANSDEEPPMKTCVWLNIDRLKEIAFQYDEQYEVSTSVENPKDDKSNKVLSIEEVVNIFNEDKVNNESENA